MDVQVQDHSLVQSMLVSLELNKKNCQKKNSNVFVHQVTLLSTCCWFPIFWLYNRQTDLSFFINIWMIDFCFKRYFRWLKWIFSRKVYFNSKCSTIIWYIILYEQNNRLSTLNQQQSFIELTGTTKPDQQSIL